MSYEHMPCAPWTYIRAHGMSVWTYIHDTGTTNVWHQQQCRGIRGMCLKFLISTNDSQHAHLTSYDSRLPPTSTSVVIVRFVARLAGVTVASNTSRVVVTSLMVAKGGT